MSDFFHRIIASRAVVFSTIDPSISAYWRLDESSGDFIDSSGNGFDASLTTVDDPIYEVDGRIGTAIQFQDLPIQDRFEASNNAGKSDVITFSLWFKQDDLDFRIPVEKQPDDTEGQGWAIKNRDDGETWIRIGSFLDNEQLKMKDFYMPKVWCNMVFVFDSGNLDVYKNGVLYDSVSGVLTGVNPLTETISIGFPMSIGPEKYAGVLDDIRIYNSALSQSKIITEIYNPGKFEDYPSGAWTPADDLSSFKLWVDFRDLSTMENDDVVPAEPSHNDPVAKVIDKAQGIEVFGGNGVTADMGVYDESVRGVRFDGISQFMESDNPIHVQDMQIHAVASYYNAASSGQFVFNAGTSSSFRDYSLQTTSALDRFEFRSNAEDNEQTTTETLSSMISLDGSDNPQTHIFTGTRTFPDSSSYKDGTFIETDTSTLDIWTKVADKFRLARGSVLFAKLVIHEIIISSLSDSSLQQKIEGYLAHKYEDRGCLDRLDVSHPYKTSPPQIESEFNSNEFDSNDFLT